MNSTSDVIMENDTDKLILQILHDTWDDFYRWERHDCAIILESLRLGQRSSDQQSLLPQWMRPAHDPLQAPLFQDAGSDSFDDDDNAIEIVEYASIPGPKKGTGKVTSITLKAPQGIMPCPRYESCLPLQHNAPPSDDPSSMPFMPFADDPAFNFVEHCRMYYKRFDWQVSMRDPNLELIVAGATRRLCDNYSLTVEQIQETCIIPARVWVDSWRKDSLPWPKDGSKTVQPCNPMHSTPERIARAMTQTFCSTCGTGYCSNHFKTVLPTPVQALVTNKALLRDTETFCSDSCFLLDSEGLLTEWTQEEMERMSLCVKYIPDMRPCDMAKICRKPCSEVFMHRINILPHENKRQPRRQVRPSPFLDHDSLSFSYHEDSPCTHDGPCSNEGGCPCALSHAHCTSKCLCKRDCPRRWQGCKCAQSKTRSTCVEKRCLCFRSNRECDPEVCIRCNASALNANGCGNVQIQQSKNKRTSVRQSAWGFGLFIEAAAKKNELIDEYVGELVYEETALSRGDAAEHRGRNYLFSLNPTLNLDSSIAGNHTRYINHSRNGANCSAKVWVVDGEQRIVITASQDVNAGEELLMDYGDSFFINDQVLPGSRENTADTEDTADELTEVNALLVEDLAQTPPLHHPSSDETYEETTHGSDSF